MNEYVFPEGGEKRYWWRRAIQTWIQRKILDAFSLL